MAAALTTDIELKKTKENITQEFISNKTGHSSKPLTFDIYDLIMLFLSVFSIILDFCTDLILVVQYYNQEFKTLAISTFILIFLPSIVVQLFSLRWHIVDKTASALHWVLHFCMLGIIHRYVQTIRAAIVAYKSKKSCDIQKVLFDQSDLCMLHLFESFLESAPQLVLQIYVIALLQEWRFWAGVSVLASLLSLAWALATYTKTQRRAKAMKNSTSWSGLLLQAIWRTGMLTSRISTLVLGAYCFGSYIFLIILMHWIAMTVWIIYQKTDFCETFWEEKIYNAVVGIIYCFCFFNLQEGQSRWRALAFYLVVIFQNLTCLTIFLMWFSEKTPKLAITGFIAIVGGTIIGSLSMLLYYRFFHPSGTIKFIFTPQLSESINPSLPYSAMTLRSLKRIQCESPSDLSQICSSRPISVNALNKSSFSDSVVIVEENVSNSVDIKTFQDWINSQDEKKYSLSKSNENEKMEIKTDAYKRRAICSSVDLVTLFDLKAKSENGCLKPSEIDETSSEILSAHDYENLCAVNITREAWGLRSWRGYSDIETWLHDDSIVHDRRLDTLTSTTSSDRSANTLQKENESTRQDDYIDSIAEDLAHCESEESLDGITGQFSVEPPSIVPLNIPKKPIFEEIEVKSTNNSDLKMKNCSASILVATIDEIRKNTFIQNHYQPSGSIYDSFSPLSDIKPKQQKNWKKVTFASKLLTFPEDDLDLSIDVSNRELENKKTDNSVTENIKFEQIEIKEEERIFKNKNKEINIPVIKTSDLECKESSKIQNINNKENIPTIANKINHWNKILSAQMDKNEMKKNKIMPPKKVSISEKKSLFLLRVLTSPKSTSLLKKKEGS